MSDLISRQDAINVADAVWSVTGDKNVAKVWDQIKDLPSAQPEIMRCRDCRYSEYDALYDDRYCHYDGNADIVPDEHYCGYAERRTDE